MPAIASYWSRMEAAFHNTLRHYTMERDADDIRLVLRFVQGGKRGNVKAVERVLNELERCSATSG